MSNKKFQKYPFQVTQLDEKSRKALKDFNLIFDGKMDVVQIGPKKYIEPANITDPIALNVLNFEARKDDIWLFGFPRSGTTMTQEMVWLIQNDLDFEGAAKEIMDHRFPVIENSLMRNNPETWKSASEKSTASEDVKSIAKKYTRHHYETLAETKDQRFIKMHWPLSLAPPSIFEVGCKVVYCARHPKDVSVSLFHLLKFFKPEEFKNATFPAFWKLFKDNLIMNTPWFEHVKEGWAKRNDKNFLFLFYEDTKKDIRGTLLKIAKFLDKNLSEDDLNKLEEHFKIENFRKNKSVNNDHFKKLGIADESKEFIRKGQVGGWREYFTPDMEAEADKWIADNLRNTDLVLPNV